MFDVTVGQLKELIKDIPDDTIVYNERVEDVYFYEHSWPINKVKGLHWSTDESEIYSANTVAYINGKLIISGHY